MWKWLMAACLLAAPAYGSEIKVVTTLAPLAGIAKLAVGDLAQVQSIVGAEQSEHGFALKPSARKAVAEADVIVMVSPEYETFMAPLLKDTKAKIIRMDGVDNVILHSPRSGGVWGEGHDHHHHGEHSHDHGDDHAHDHSNNHHIDHHGLDGHVWLDPRNASALVTALSEALALEFNAKAPEIRAAAQMAQLRILDLDFSLATQLAGLKQKPFVVFHDAFQYFEKRYQLNGVGALTIDPDRPINPKTLGELKDRLKGQAGACLFREPQYPAKIVDELAAATNAKVAVLNPLGDDYLVLMAQLGQNLSACLK